MIIIHKCVQVNREDNMSKKEKLISATQVADIWNERAKQMGYPDTNYTRFSVRQRRHSKKGGITPVMETEVGALYKESDARSIQIHPERSRRPQRVSEQS